MYGIKKISWRVGIKSRVKLTPFPFQFCDTTLEIGSVGYAVSIYLTIQNFVEIS